MEPKNFLKIQPQNLIQTLLSCFHNFTLCSCKIHLNVIIPSMPSFSCVKFCGPVFFINLSFTPYETCQVNTLWTGDADLRLYITTVQDG